MNIDTQFIIETLIVAIILTSYVAYIHCSQRKEIKKELGDECKKQLSFFKRHPFITILIDFIVFFLITFFVKLLHDIIFS